MFKFWRERRATVILALLPLWIGGMFGRTFWTPDEPREADIVWNMQQQPEKAVPRLAGKPFLEKPPLLYWLAAPLAAVWGPRAAALRLPNLLYAILATLCVVALASRCGNSQAAWIAGLVSGSFLLALQVAVWLATDAPLVAAVAVSLLGLWIALQAHPGLTKLGGYLLFHLGLALAFFAKGISGWMVPLLALGTLIVWQRRWREAINCEFWVGGLVLVAAISPWIVAVARGPDGNDHLLGFFWWNTVGRFVDVGAPAEIAYAKDHQNSLGKYFIEAPLNLLPWFLLCIAALQRAWRLLRTPQHAVDIGRRDAWQFALAAFVPGLLLLSLSTTARAVYAAPLLPGLGLLVGLWGADALTQPRRLDRVLLRATAALLGLLLTINLILLPLLVMAARNTERSTLVPIAWSIAAIGGVCGCAWRAWHAAGAPDVLRSIRFVYAGFAAWLLLTGLSCFGWLDRAQDLRGFVSALERTVAGRPLVLYRPDETTRAVIDMYAPTLARRAQLNVRAPAELFASLRRSPESRILVKSPDYMPGPVRQALAQWGVPERSPRMNPDVADLLREGKLQIVGDLGIPDGRRYWLLQQISPPDSLE